MSTNLPEQDDYTTNVEINTDGEPFNQAGYWKTVQGVNNRVVNLKNRVTSLEVGNPELEFMFGGQTIYIDSTDPVVGDVKRGIDLTGNRPTYSVPNQYWGDINANGSFVGGGGYPDFNVQYSGSTGSVIATPNEWMIDRPNNFSDNHLWTQAQTRSQFRVYAPVSGWYQVQSWYKLQYREFYATPVGYRQEDLSVAILHQTAANGVNSSNYGSYVDEYYKDEIGISAPTDPETKFSTVQFGATRVIYLAGDSTDLADSYYPEFYIAPNYYDLYIVGAGGPETTTSTPYISGTIRLTKIPDIQSTP